MGNRIKTLFLLVIFAVLIMAVGMWLGGQTGLIMAFVISLAINFGTYWASDKIVLKMYRAQPVANDHPLRATVAQLAAKAGIPMPRVFILPGAGHNAFATGRNPDHAAVAITQSLYDALDQDELEGVISHELAHIKNRDTLIMVVAATMASTLMFIISMARWAAIFGIGGRGGGGRGGPGLIELLALMIIGPLVALFIQSAISRSREYVADQGGAKIAGSPYGLAKALVKLERVNQAAPTDQASPHTAHMFIVNPLKSQFMVKIFSTHPPIDDRVRALLGEEQSRAFYTNRG